MSSKLEKACRRGISALAALTLFFSFHVPVFPAAIEVPPLSFAALSSDLITSIEIPKTIGRVQETHIGTSPRTFVIVQDAHGIPDAQQSIQKMIGFFQETYGISVVAVEGGASAMDVQIFKSFPEQDLLKDVFSTYHEKGELSGSAAAALFNETSALYHGIENWELYEAGLKLFLAAMQAESDLLDSVQPLRTQLQEQKESIYSPQLWEVDQAWQNFQADHMEMVPVLSMLSKIRPLEESSELQLILNESTRLQNDSVILETEIRRIFNEVRTSLEKVDQNSESRQDYMALQEKHQAFQTSRLSPQEFAHYLETLAIKYQIRIQVSKELDLLVHEQRRLRDIKGTRLFREFETYVRTIKEELFRANAERELDVQSRHLELLERLIRLELSREDWKQIQEKVKNIERENVPDFLSVEEDWLWQRLQNHIAFYENAEMRDIVFVKRLEELMQEAKAEQSLLVAGGFHAEGLCQRLRARGDSYILLMPQIGMVPEVISYRDHMQGKVSWSDYLQVENGQLHPQKAFIRATRDRLLAKALRDPGRILKSWRDQIIRDLSAQGRIHEAADYTSFIDELVQGSEWIAGTPEWMKRVDFFLDGLKQLEVSGQLNEQNILHLLQPATIVDGLGVAAFTGDRIFDVRLNITARSESREEDQRVREDRSFRVEAAVQQIMAELKAPTNDPQSFFTWEPIFARQLPGHEGEIDLPRLEREIRKNPKLQDEDVREVLDRLLFIDPAVAGSGAIARVWLQQFQNIHGFDLIALVEARLAQRRDAGIEEPFHILDVGAGTFPYLAMMLDRYFGDRINVAAIEYAEADQRVAATRVHFIQGEGLEQLVRLREEGVLFDLILSTRAMRWISQGPPESKVPESERASRGQQVAQHVLQLLHPQGQASLQYTPDRVGQEVRPTTASLNRPGFTALHYTGTYYHDRDLAGNFSTALFSDMSQLMAEEGEDDLHTYPLQILKIEPVRSGPDSVNPDTRRGADGGLRSESRSADAEDVPFSQNYSDEEKIFIPSDQAANHVTEAIFRIFELAKRRGYKVILTGGTARDFSIQAMHGTKKFFARTTDYDLAILLPEERSNIQGDFYEEAYEDLGQMMVEENVIPNISGIDPTHFYLDFIPGMHIDGQYTFENMLRSKWGNAFSVSRLAIEEVPGGFVVFGEPSAIENLKNRELEIWLDGDKTPGEGMAAKMMGKAAIYRQFAGFDFVPASRQLIERDLENVRQEGSVDSFMKSVMSHIRILGESEEASFDRLRDTIRQFNLTAVFETNEETLVSFVRSDSTLRSGPDSVNPDTSLGADDSLRSESRDLENSDLVRKLFYEDAPLTKDEYDLIKVLIPAPILTALDGLDDATVRERLRVYRLAEGGINVALKSEAGKIMGSVTLTHYPEGYIHIGVGHFGLFDEPFEDESLNSIFLRDKVFAWWFQNHLVPFTRSLGSVNELRIIQTALHPDVQKDRETFEPGTLRQLGFTPIDPNFSAKGSIWVYDLNSRLLEEQAATEVRAVQTSADQDQKNSNELEIRYIKNPEAGELRLLEDKAWNLLRRPVSEPARTILEITTFLLGSAPESVARFWSLEDSVQGSVGFRAIIYPQDFELSQTAQALREAGEGSVTGLVVIAPEFQNQGWGRKLMQESLQSLRENPLPGIRYYQASIELDNTASRRTLYRSAENLGLPIYQPSDGNGLVHVVDLFPERPMSPQAAIYTADLNRSESREIDGQQLTTPIFPHEVGIRYTESPNIGVLNSLAEKALRLANRNEFFDDSTAPVFESAASLLARGPDSVPRLWTLQDPLRGEVGFRVLAYPYEFHLTPSVIALQRAGEGIVSGVIVIDPEFRNEKRWGRQMVQESFRSLRENPLPGIRYYLASIVPENTASLRALYESAEALGLPVYQPADGRGVTYLVDLFPEKPLSPQAAVYAASLNRSESRQTPEAHAAELTVTKPVSQILVVEDSRIIREIYQGMANQLEQKGIDLFLLEDGQEALEVLTAEDALMAFDLVISDIDMPRLNGNDMARQLRRHETDTGKPPLPLFFASARKRNDADVAGIANSTFIQKDAAFQFIQTITAAIDLINSRSESREEEAGELQVMNPNQVMNFHYGIEELLSNAARNAREKVRLDIQIDTEFVQISIQDDGVGFQPAALKTIAKIIYDYLQAEFQNYPNGFDDYLAEQYGSDPAVLGETEKEMRENFIIFYQSLKRIVLDQSEDWADFHQLFFGMPSGEVIVTGSTPGLPLEDVAIVDRVTGQRLLPEDLGEVKEGKKETGLFFVITGLMNVVQVTSGRGRDSARQKLESNLSGTFQTVNNPGNGFEAVVRIPVSVLSKGEPDLEKLKDDIQKLLSSSVQAAIGKERGPEKENFDIDVNIQVVSRSESRQDTGENIVSSETVLWVSELEAIAESAATNDFPILAYRARELSGRLASAQVLSRMPAAADVKATKEFVSNFREASKDNERLRVMAAKEAARQVVANYLDPKSVNARQLAGILSHTLPAEVSVEEFSQMVREEVSRLIDSIEVKDPAALNVSPELAEFAVEYFVSVLTQNLKGSLVIAFDVNNASENFTQALQKVKSHVGLALFARNEGQRENLNRESLDGFFFRFENLKRLRANQLLSENNNEAVPVVHDGMNMDYLGMNSILFGVGVNEQGRSTFEEPYYEVIERVAQMVTGLLAADQLKQAGELQDSEKIKELQRVLAERIFDQFNGRDGVISVVNGEIQINRDSLSRFVTEYLAARMTEASA